MDDNISFGELLKNLVCASGMTQSEFYGKLKITRNWRIIYTTDSVFMFTLIYYLFLINQPIFPPKISWCKFENSWSIFENSLQKLKISTSRN